MHKKKPLCLGFVVLLLSMVTVTMPVGGGVEPSPNALYVWPDSYTNFSELDTLKKGDTFTVDVMVKLDVGVNLGAWWYKLKWDSTNIELTNHTINLPEGSGVIWMIVVDEVGTGYHNASASMMIGSVPCVTPRSIATYNFTVIETIYEPEPDEIGTLDLQDYDYGLWDDIAQQIPHTVYDGQYRKCAIPPPGALYVWPDSYTNFSELDTLKKGDMFTVDVMVKLEDGVLLGGWFYQLKWDSTNIELTNYTVNLPGPPAVWIWADQLGTDHHNVTGSMLIGSVPCVTPRSIGTYNFTVIETIKAPEPDEIGTLDLQDLDSGLYNEIGQPIPHTVSDGQYRKCAITILGDINLDGIVDILDIGICCKAFGSYPGDPRWKPQADLDKGYSPDLIDIYDLVLIGTNFGKTL